MGKIDIVIPTYNRADKLKKCLDSIIKQTYENWEVLVFVNGTEFKTFEFLNDIEDLRINYFTNNDNYVVNTWNNYFYNFFNARQPDYVALLVDDVELYEDCLYNAIDCFKSTFGESTDGVLGLAQECPGHPEYTFKWYGQVLIGNSFIQRYKEVNYRVCCPQYTHFYQDEETYLFANELNKFVNCEKAKLKHYHPGFIKTNYDEAHYNCRGKVKKKDDIMYEKRRKANYIWGKTWQIIV